MTKVVELKNVTKIFHSGTPDAFVALNDINYTINSGDFITIVGGNGAGKSTFLNTIAGGFSVDKGSIIMKGADVTAINEEGRAQYVGRVFQDPKMGTAPRLTVAQNLALAELRGQTRRLKRALDEEQRLRYAEALKLLDLGLEQRLDAEIGLLSGGQRQAITLLMATLKRPDILLLDEHTAALDPKTSKKILELTNQYVQEKNLTAVMITHNLQDALTYGNRMILLHRGQIIRDFTQEEKEALTASELYTLMEEV